MTIAPVEASRSSYNGLLVFGFIAIAIAADGRWWCIACRAGCGARRRGIAGFLIRRRPASIPAAVSPSRCGGCLARWCSERRETVDMPAPGDNRPAQYRAADRRPDLGHALCPARAGCGLGRGPCQRAAVPDDPALSGLRLRRPGRAAAGADAMAMTTDGPVGAAGAAVSR